MTSRDGYLWTPDQGLKAGIPCIGRIQPPTKLNGPSPCVYDVIVVGAGYCGLTVLRDISLAGLRVLLLEGRDRIGGRSWSSNIDGYPFEMGGTWIHWGQAHVWREIMRYQMQDKIEISMDFSSGVNQYLQASPKGTQRFSHEEEYAIMDSGLQKLFNIDGQWGKRVMPFPHSASFTREALAYDRMSVADRIRNIEDSLTLNERRGIEAWVLVCSGGTLETVSFLEVLHWWALSGYSYEGCIEYLAKYKFKDGQSSFAMHFFQEALATNNLDYVFDCPVVSVKDTGNTATVTARDGQKFEGKRIVSTIPLNVLNSVVFDPPLRKGKKRAADTGHVNQIVKVHAEVSNKDLRSYTGISYPHNPLYIAFGDGTTQAANTHIVSFGGQHLHFHPEEDIPVTIKALQGLVPMDIETLVFHNWSKDEFARGAWFFPGPRLLSDHLFDMRAREGNIYFANSDWALGWRSFIDGAIEEGTRTALVLRNDLMNSLMLDSKLT
ncbi:amine oxidase [Aspergillus pseudotamarii]|uniref:Amine oxidase n=1 Tax=Aspergillus pseudotamarii TaxID=132259 RepID=A0A5N6TCH3_ASPPS|nr:amine oxidase [Aspergillus pseudotamarii]KAE8143967.1 amine oxidase [Aspergillus pseudotamarii]